MKVYEKTITEIVRISFGHTKSISFCDTTFDEVRDLVHKVFADLKVTKTITLKDHPVWESPKSSLSLSIGVRLEGSAHAKRLKTNRLSHKGMSRTKQLYGLTADEAYDYFMNNYKKYLS